MSITTTPEQIVNPPAPEDIERLHMLPRDETTGRRAVLLGDMSLGHSIAREAVQTNVEARKAKDENHGSIYRPDFFYLSSAERDALTEWEDVVHDGSQEAMVLPWGEALKQELNDARERFRQIDVNAFGDDFDYVLNKTAPPILVNAVTKWLNENSPELVPDTEVPEGIWLKWLSRDLETPEDERQQLNFLQWHNHRLEALQKNPDFAEAITEQIEEYKLAVQKAEAEGWLAEGTYDRSKIFLGPNGSWHFVGDEFYAAFFGGMAAYAQQAQGRTFYNPSHGEELAEVVRSTAKHEFNHLLGSLPGRWLNEAVTEHIAQCLEGRELEAVHSNGRDGSYSKERSLLAAVINVANSIQLGRGELDDLITVSDFTRVYSTGDSGEQREQLMNLIERLEDIYGFSILSALGNYITIMEDKLEKNGMSQRDREAEVAELAIHMVHQQPEKLGEMLKETIEQAAKS